MFVQYSTISQIFVGSTRLYQCTIVRAAVFFFLTTLLSLLKTVDIPFSFYSLVLCRSLYLVGPGMRYAYTEMPVTITMDFADDGMMNHETHGGSLREDLMSLP